MRKAGLVRGVWLLTQSLGILGIILGLLSTWLPLPHRDLIGTLLILFGGASLLSGLLWAWIQVRSGAPSPTGRTSNQQAAFQQAQMMKHEPSSQLADLMPSGGLPSPPRKPLN